MGALRFQRGRLTTRPFAFELATYQPGSPAQLENEQAALFALSLPLEFVVDFIFTGAIPF